MTRTAVGITSTVDAIDYFFNNNNWVEFVMLTIKTIMMFSNITREHKSKLPVKCSVFLITCR